MSSIIGYDGEKFLLSPESSNGYEEIIMINKASMIPSISSFRLEDQYNYCTAPLILDSVYSCLYVNITYEEDGSQLSSAMTNYYLENL
jgi:hypothetical protein